MLHLRVALQKFTLMLCSALVNLLMFDWILAVALSRASPTDG